MRQLGIRSGAGGPIILRGRVWGALSATWPEGHVAAGRRGAGGIHPAVLTDRGLEAALDALVQRAPLPVRLRAVVPERLDTGIDAAAYLLVSGTLTNVAGYAQADEGNVDVASTGGTLLVTIADDGIGGADPGQGSGLRGPIDRVIAVGGHLELVSAPEQEARYPQGEQDRVGVGEG